MHILKVITVISTGQWSIDFFAKHQYQNTECTEFWQKDHTHYEKGQLSICRTFLFLDVKNPYYKFIKINVNNGDQYTGLRSGLLLFLYRRLKVDTVGRIGQIEDYTWLKSIKKDQD